nr:oligopeptide/dipeptide ABC transporter ATP-binding protein [uncultured Oscillibacter sp.]
MGQTILRVEHLCKDYISRKTKIHAVNDVSFTVQQGETVGIVGESGCGKTTLGRMIVRAIPATSGKVIYTAADGQEYDLQALTDKEMKKIRSEVQMIFQDPYSSLDPRMTVFDIISEPLRANYKDMPKAEMETRVKQIAEKVGLNPSYLKRYPHAFSGGQRQRIGIARALVLLPRLIVCDEAVSALDVSVQAQVVNLLRDLQQELGLTYLFISHDLSVIEHISDQVGVMYLGRMVEYAPADSLFRQPMHPYSEALLSAIPIADPTITLERIPLEGEIPNPANAPSGCYFHPRCRYCTECCKSEWPQSREVAPNRFTACLRIDDLSLQGLPMDKINAHSAEHGGDPQ